MTDILAPVVGNMWQITVATGDQVSTGDTIAIMESMKMEIPVEAPHDGVVEILVEEGVLVQQDEVIATVS